MPGVWQPLDRRLPDATDAEGEIILASVVPGHIQVIVLVNQHDGKYSVKRMSPGRRQGVLKWAVLHHAPDLALERALEEVKRMTLSAYSVAVQLSDIEDRIMAQERS